MFIDFTIIFIALSHTRTGMILTLGLIGVWGKLGDLTMRCIYFWLYIGLILILIHYIFDSFITRI